MKIKIHRSENFNIRETKLNKFTFFFSNKTDCLWWTCPKRSNLTKIEQGVIKSKGGGRK